MKEIKTETLIKGTPDKIWQMLVDFDKYPKWNPFVKQISGNLNEGKLLKVMVQPVDGKAMQFKPSVLNVEKNKELRWLGKFLFKGLFDGEHYFILTDNNDGTTTLVQGEKFSGILVGLFDKMLDKTEQGFMLMNEALKQQIENE